MEEELRKRKESHPNEEESDKPNPVETSDYVIQHTFKERIEDIVRSLIGNGYDLFTKPHTATWLIMFMVVVIYYTCFLKKPEESIEDSVKSGVLLICGFIIVFGANQFKEGPISRPHPAIWKMVLAVAVIYECFLLFILSLSPENARQFMRFFDPKLGTPLVYRDYAADCRIYIPENANHFKNIKDVFGDIFILAHFLGWIWKAFIFRDWSILWFLSLWFEDLEVTAQHILPNFQECWWDKMLADVFGCNLLGMILGMWINRRLAAREYHWVAYPNIKTKKERVHRFFLQFSPHDWKVYDWDIFGSFKSCAQTAFICCIVETAEMNAFFLKSVLWVEPDHYLVTLRLIIWGLLALPAVREAYDFFHDPNNHRLGQNFWMSICMIATECLIEWKMGEGILYGGDVPPFPPVVKGCWMVFLGLIILWILVYLIFGGGRHVKRDYDRMGKLGHVLSNTLLYSIPIPMLYLLFWDMVLKPHIAFDSVVA